LRYNTTNAVAAPDHQIQSVTPEANPLKCIYQYFNFIKLTMFLKESASHWDSLDSDQNNLISTSMAPLSAKDIYRSQLYQLALCCHFFCY
jgi:hypothetical protein